MADQFVLWEWNGNPYAMAKFVDTAPVWQFFVLTRRYKAIKPRCEDETMPGVYRFSDDHPPDPLTYRVIDPVEADTLLAFDAIPLVPVSYDEEGNPKVIRLVPWEDEDDGGLYIVKGVAECWR